MTKEANSRLKINKLLEESGWILVDTPESKSNVIVEPKVKQTETNDIGFIDWLWLRQNGKNETLWLVKNRRDPTQ